MSERIDQSPAPKDTPERTDIRVSQSLPTGTARAELEVDFARRALLQAGWTVPVVIAAGLPRTAHAISNPPHTDNPHTDGPHTDHTDTPHIDSPHSDAPHTDTPHTDHSDTAHSDLAHTDSAHTDHTDTAHSDTSHTDITVVTTGNENDNGGDNDNDDDDDDDGGSSHSDVEIRQITSGGSGDPRFSTIPPIRPPSTPGVLSASPTGTPASPGVASAQPPAATSQPVGAPPVAVARPTPSVLPQAGEAGLASVRPYAFAGLGLIAAGIGLRLRRWFVRDPQGDGGDADPGGPDTESNTDSTAAP